MATGGSFKRSTVDSEMIYDFNCSICIRNKRGYSEAVKYCPECDKYFCQMCLSKADCSHDYIGRGNLAKWGTPSRRTHFDECPRHTNNLIQLYCKTDDVVGCSICGQTRHKNCGPLEYIPVYVGEKLNKAALESEKKLLVEFHQKVDALLQDRKTRQTSLESLHSNLVADVKRYKKEIIALLDSLEKSSLQHLDDFKSEAEAKIKFELNQLQDIQRQSSDLLLKVSNVNLEDALKFARLKQGKEFVNDNRDLLSSLSRSKFPAKAEFKADKSLEACLKSLQGLGTLVTDTVTDKPQAAGMAKVSKTKKSPALGHQDPTINKPALGRQDPTINKPALGHQDPTINKPALGHQDPTINKPALGHQDPTINKPALGHQDPTINKPYTVSRKTSFNVKVEGDTETCDIWGMCQLPDGGILLVDNNNKSLKQYDSTYRALGRCPLSDQPRDVCSTEPGEVAVALGGQTVQFVSVGDKMRATKSFSTRDGCRSLAYHNKRLYVISWGGRAVAVYEPSGSLLHTLRTDQHGSPLFSGTRYITACTRTGRLYVADGDRGLVTVDLEGNLLARFKPPELAEGAVSVCLDRAGNVFVGGCSTNSLYPDTMVQVGREADRTLAQILSPSDRMSPGRLCFDNVGTRLLVARRDTVSVLHLSQ